MTMRYSFIAAAMLAVAPLAASSAAHAQSDGPFYGHLQLGADVPENMNFSNAATANLKLDPDTGIAMTGAIGYRLAPPLRLEAQFGYAHNELGGTFNENVLVFAPCGTVPSQPCLAPNVTGNMVTFSGFLMGYYDFPQLGLLKPYAGIGVGFVNVDMDVGSVGTLNDGTRSRFAIIDHSDTTVGYRGTVGFAYEMGPVDLTLGYTYTFTDKLDLPGRGPNVSFNFNKRINTHTINAGVVYNF